ncbi:MAG: general stress protein [Armatimonadetes bacterium]|nr:general stress protein [Armatimonadota bacterium]
MSTLVTGMFDNRMDAEHAVDALLARGAQRDDISIVVNEQARSQYFPDDSAEGMGNKAGEGAGVGAAVGGTLGAIGGALALTAGNLFLPGVGLLAAGPLLAGLAGAGAGGLAGTLVGALVGMGIPEEEAAHYETGLREGRILVGVNVREGAEAEARAILNAQGANQTEAHGGVR